MDSQLVLIVIAFTQLIKNTALSILTENVLSETALWKNEVDFLLLSNFVSDLLNYCETNCYLVTYN